MAIPDDPLFLPPMSAKPSYSTLLDLLVSLEIHPSTWNGSVTEKKLDVSKEKEVNVWLPSIFRSEFSWFEDTTDTSGKISTADEKREEIFDLAARRIAERCGRSATSDITRTWTIPSNLFPEHTEDLQIIIHEPGLTEGNTGHKTWGTAFALIKELASYKKDPSFFGGVFVSDINTNEKPTLCSNKRILELGSGTGLLGISASAIWSCPVVLTDLEVIIPNLKRNVKRNIDSIFNRGGNLQVETLDWDNHAEALALGTFEIILASDPLYDDEQVNMLANTIDRFLDPSMEGRALVAVPLRDMFSRKLTVKFQQAMELRGFEVHNHGFVIARDDFGDGQEEVTIQRDIYGRRYRGKT